MLRIVADAPDERILEDLELRALHYPSERPSVRAVMRQLSDGQPVVEAIATSIPRREARWFPFGRRALQIAEVAAGRSATLHAAADIIDARAALRRELNDLQREATVAVVVLTPLPLVGLLLGLAPTWTVPPPNAARLTTWFFAGALTALGAIWMWRVARPPFSYRPRDWRAHVRLALAESRLLDILDDAALLASAGSVTGAGLEDLEPWPRDITLGPVASALRRLSQIVERSSSSQGAPADRIVMTEVISMREAMLARTRRQWRAFPQAVIVPTVVCILPAALLFLMSS